MTMTEVSKPAPKLLAQSSTNAVHALSVATFGLVTHTILEFLQALLPRRLRCQSRVRWQQAGSVGNTPCQSECATSLLALLVRVSSTCGPSKHMDSPTPVSTGAPGRCSHKGHCGRLDVPFPAFSHSASISLHPFAPPALSGFITTMGALTSEQPVLRTRVSGPALCLAGVTAHEHRPDLLPSSPCFMCRTFPPFRLQPLVAVPGPQSASLPGTHRVAFRPHPFRGHRRQLGFVLSRGSATTTSRIEFDSYLRTDVSPPVALHLPSRGRSYFQLRSSDHTSAGTFTLPIQHTRKRTRSGILPLLLDARASCRVLSAASAG